MYEKIRYVNIALALGVFLASALVAKDYLVYRHAPAKAAPSPVSFTTPGPPPPLNSFAAIVEKQMFPSASRSFTEIGVAGQSAPPALAGMKLLGTFVGERRLAVIETADGVQEVYSEGESINGGVLKEISDKKVMIAADAKELTLTIEEEGPGTEAQPEQTGGTAAAAPEPSRYSRQTGDQEWVIDRKAVINSLDDMGRIMSDARLTPRILNGSVEGFLVSELKPRGVFDAIGIKNGDVLKRINGFEIDSPEKAVQALSALKGMNEASLDIVRSGKAMSLRYRIR